MNTFLPRLLAETTIINRLILQEVKKLALYLQRRETSAPALIGAKHMVVCPPSIRSVLLQAQAQSLPSVQPETANRNPPRHPHLKSHCPMHVRMRGRGRLQGPRKAHRLGQGALQSPFNHSRLLHCRHHLYKVRMRCHPLHEALSVEHQH